MGVLQLAKGLGGILQLAKMRSEAWLLAARAVSAVSLVAHAVCRCLLLAWCPTEAQVRRLRETHRHRDLAALMDSPEFGFGPDC